MKRKDLIRIKEGSTDIFVYSVDKESVPSKSMNVFYNRTMEINRDISNLAIISYNKLYNRKKLIIVDSMAATGISSIRMLKECDNIKKIYINDKNPIAVDLIYKNLALNDLNSNTVELEITNNDANLLFSEIANKSYIELEDVEQTPNVISIDPFGTPNRYIDSALKTIKKVNGLMCITATDTAVLFGIRPSACIRKYLSIPLHTEYCKEIGARILLHFISKIANINKLGIKPLLTFYSNHFIRIFALTFKGEKKITDNFSHYGYILHCGNCGYRSFFSYDLHNVIQKCPLCKESGKIQYAGPLWIGNIHDRDFVEDLIIQNQNLNYNNTKRIAKILELIIDEIGMPLSYYNLHKLSQKLKLPDVPRIKDVLDKIQKKGYKASRTHFDFLSIKTDMNIKILKGTILAMKD